MPGADELVSPQGTPLIRDPKLIVLKYPKSSPITPKAAEAISRLTGCQVVLLPMDCELMMGKLAAQEVESVHAACHAIQEFEHIHFNKNECEVLYKSLQFIQKQLCTDFNAKSPEVSLLKKLAKIVKSS